MKQLCVLLTLLLVANFVLGGIEPSTVYPWNNDPAWSQNPEIASILTGRDITYTGKWVYDGQDGEGVRTWRWEVVVDGWPLTLDYAVAHWTCHKWYDTADVTVLFDAWPWQDEAHVVDGGANWNAIAHGTGRIELWPGRHTLVTIRTPAVASYAAVLANRDNDITTTIGISDPLNDGLILEPDASQAGLGEFLSWGFATLVQYQFYPPIDYDQNGWVNMVDLAILLSRYGEDD